MFRPIIRLAPCLSALHKDALPINSLKSVMEADVGRTSRCGCRAVTSVKNKVAYQFACYYFDVTGRRARLKNGRRFRSACAGAREVTAGAAPADAACLMRTGWLDYHDGSV